MKIKLFLMLAVITVNEINATEVAPQQPIPAITFPVTLDIPLFTFRHTNFVYSASFSPDGEYVVTASTDKTAKIWNAQTGQLLHTLKGHKESVVSASFSPDGKYVVTASYKTAGIWDVETGTLLQKLVGHKDRVTSVRFSPDGSKIVTASQDGTAKIWDVETGKEKRTLKGHTDLVSSAYFSPDGNYIVTASWDKTVKIWDVANDELLHTLSHTNWVFSASFSPDGTKVVTACGDKTAKILNVADGALLHTLSHTNWVESASFSPDGKYVVTASADKTAKIWNAQTGQLLHTLSHTDAVVSAQFSPDGRYIVTASNDDTAKIWNTATGELIATLKGHTKGVNSAAFSPDGAKVVTASSDKTAKIWDVGQVLKDYEKLKVKNVITYLHEVINNLKKEVFTEVNKMVRPELTGETQEETEILRKTGKDLPPLTPTLQPEIAKYVGQLDALKAKIDNFEKKIDASKFLKALNVNIKVTGTPLWNDLERIKKVDTPKLIELIKKEVFAENLKEKRSPATALLGLRNPAKPEAIPAEEEYAPEGFESEVE